MNEDRSEWLRCRPWIESALDYADGTHTIEDIEAGIASGRYQFWAGKRCALVTEIIEYPRLKAMNYFLIGGDISELKQVEPCLTAWAKAQGCKRVIGVGRKGFERAFAGYGFKPRWTYIAKELSA